MIHESQNFVNVNSEEEDLKIEEIELGSLEPTGTIDSSDEQRTNAMISDSPINKNSSGKNFFLYIDNSLHNISNLEKNLIKNTKF